MKVVAALVPFVGMFVVFVVVVRAIVFGDRREREALKRLEAMDAGQGAGAGRTTAAPTVSAENAEETPGATPSTSMQSETSRRAETR